MGEVICAILDRNLMGSGRNPFESLKRGWNDKIRMDFTTGEVG
jgi:hypothetical protein